MGVRRHFGRRHFYVAVVISPGRRRPARRPCLAVIFGRRHFWLSSFWPSRSFLLAVVIFSLSVVIFVRQ